MRPALFSLAALAALNTISSQAQTISGTVRNASTQEPIPFVNVGLPKRSLGTVSDEQGRYQLPAKVEYADDTVRVSSIGFEPVLLPLRALTARPDLELKPQAVVLNDVQVAAKGTYRKLRTVGYPPNRKVAMSMSTNQLGTEIGTVIRVPKHPVLLQSLHVFVLKNEAGPLTFRFNLYRLDAQGLPTTGKLLNRDVLLTATPQAGLLTIDLAANKLVLDENFLLALEWVQAPPGAAPVDLTKQIKFAGALDRNEQFFVRSASQGQWTKPSINITSKVPLLGMKPAVALYATVKE